MTFKKIAAVFLVGFFVVGTLSLHDVFPKTDSPAFNAAAANVDFIGKGSEGDYYCHYLSGNAIAVNGYSGSSDSISIPSSINGYSVKYVMCVSGYNEWGSAKTVDVPTGVSFLDEAGTIIDKSGAAWILSEYNIVLKVGGNVVEPVEPQVKKCGENAFYELSDDGVLIISGSGKMDCFYNPPWEDYKKEITEINIENGITSMNGFKGCTNLKSVSIPDSVITIDKSVFSGCSGLTSIKIPDSVTSIGSRVFLGTPWLDNKQKEDPLVVVNGIVIDASECKGDVVIPKTVVCIGNNSFSYSDATSVTIPGSVKSIESWAFQYSNVVSVNILDGVTSIGVAAFDTCENLSSITIPSSVKNIEGLAFQECSHLSSVIINEGIEEIGRFAFSGCTSLTDITIPQSVTYIGVGAFYSKNIFEITILNPNCKIYPNMTSIQELNGNFDRTIHGYANSTAQAYAEKYGYNFEAIEDNPDSVVYGDANCDGKVTIADSTAILQHLGNEDKYGLSAQGKENADVDGRAGVTTEDALTIQMIDAKLLSISDLPLKTS